MTCWGCTIASAICFSTGWRGSVTVELSSLLSFSGSSVDGSSPQKDTLARRRMQGSKMKRNPGQAGGGGPGAVEGVW